MESDDIQAIWRAYDSRLEASLRLNSLLVRRASLSRTETALARLSRGLSVELAINALAVFLIGGFAADSVRDTPVFIAALALGLYAIAILAAGVVQLVALAKIDFDEPVLAVTRAFERFRLLRARTIFWTLALAPLLWPALLIVALRGLAGANAAAIFGLPWIAANVAFGVAVLFAALWSARRFGPRLGAASPLGRTLNALAGRDVRVAAEQLDTLSRYEAEGG